MASKVLDEEVSDRVLVRRLFKIRGDIGIIAGKMGIIKLDIDQMLDCATGGIELASRARCVRVALQVEMQIPHAYRSRSQHKQEQGSYDIGVKCAKLSPSAN